MMHIFDILDKFLKIKFTGELTVEIVCFRLILAILFGGIVGYEREKNNRPAGFRTHILVCFGAAIVSMVQDQLRLNILDLASTEGSAVASVIKTDLGRLGAQVISGVGFLGAGSIMKEKGEFYRGHIVNSIGLELAEATSEYVHQLMRKEVGIIDKDINIEDILKAQYQGNRYSFGYPACPNLEDQDKLFRLLKPERFGIRLTEEHMMYPEATVSAIVFSQPFCKYFNM